jgi:hypothetical protein
LYQTLEHNLPLFNTGSSASARQQHLIIPNTTMPDADASSRFGETPLQVNALHGMLPEFSAQPTHSWAIRPATILDTHFGDGEFDQQQSMQGVTGQEQVIDMETGHYFWN